MKPIMNRALLSSILIALAMLTGCATTAPVGEAKYRLSDFEKPGTDAELDISDPLEPLNKSLYRFNYYFDSYFFIPLVDAYQFVIPDYAEQRIASFFDNIADIRNTFNGALQLKPASTGTSLSRFAINSTVGVFGLWDPASTWGLQRQDEDFGQTLGHYGVDNGPYLVLPVFGPPTCATRAVCWSMAGFSPALIHSISKRMTWIRRTTRYTPSRPENANRSAITKAAHPSNTSSSACSTPQNGNCRLRNSVLTPVA